MAFVVIHDDTSEETEKDPRKNFFVTLLRDTLKEIRKNPYDTSACKNFFDALFSQNLSEFILRKKREPREEPDKEQINAETSYIWRNY